MNFVRALPIMGIVALVLARGQTQSTPDETTPERSSQVSAEVAPPVYRARVEKAYPHDPAAFTEGLIYFGGELYESLGSPSGLPSELRRVELATGRVLQRRVVPDVFAEGLALVGSKLLQLTWQDGRGFIYDRASFARVGEWKYRTEGWGLAAHGRELVMSDGSAWLYFLDPQTLKELRRVRVTAAGDPVTQLNELEIIRGEIWANVWLTDKIARIDPQTGRVVAWVDLTGVLPESLKPASQDGVPNGIAYDAMEDRIFVTGKFWPRLFEIKLLP